MNELPSSYPPEDARWTPDNLATMAVEIIDRLDPPPKGIGKLLKSNPMRGVEADVELHGSNVRISMWHSCNDGELHLSFGPGSTHLILTGPKSLEAKNTELLPMAKDILNLQESQGVPFRKILQQSPSNRNPAPLTLLGRAKRQLHF